MQLLPVLLAALAPTATLQVELRPKGETRTPVYHAALRCGPPGGTHPHPAVACAALARLAHPFAPVPKNVACSEIYSGPQWAHVTGTFRGAHVDARFRRTDSCQTQRWSRVASLLAIQ